MYPFAAVHQLPQRSEFGVDRYSAGVFDCVARAHLIRDRADTAHPSGEVRRLGVCAAAQEGFEEARRLVDVELDGVHGTVDQRDMQCAFAFDTGQGAH